MDTLESETERAKRFRDRAVEARQEKTRQRTMLANLSLTGVIAALTLANILLILLRWT